MKTALLAFACILLLTPPAAKGQTTSIPDIHRRITDLDNTLSSGEVAALESKLAEFEQETSNQIAVLVIPSLQGESLEDYSFAVAEKNKFGRKGRNNGVLLIVAKGEHQIRFEVGYGLEGALPDATCDQIIRHIIVPKFRRGDYYGGLDDGISAVMLATKGEFHRTGRDQSAPGTIGVIGFIALFLFMLLFGLLPRLALGGRRFHVNSGGWRSSGPWFGGFGGGGFGGGGFGGGFGGGGFSGGGGGFGGGGASGSW